MRNRSRSPYQYGSIRRQMARVTSEHQRRLRQTWIQRVLDILGDDNLMARAALQSASDIEIIFECNFAPEVWDDPRIAFRLKQLAANDIVVELIDHEHAVAGRTFNRTQIRVASSR